MKKLTARQALLECRKMWNWLAKHPTASKRDYFKSKNISDKDTPTSGCYMCQYVLEHLSVTVPFCSPECTAKCLLTKLIWEKGCTNTATSPYHLWKLARISSESSIYAKQIADACTTVLKSLPKGKS